MKVFQLLFFLSIISSINLTAQLEVYTHNVVSESNMIGIPKDASFGDLDLDGDIDVICLDRANGTIVFFENINGKHFKQRELKYYAEDYVDNSSIKLADLDGDGALDIVTAATSGFGYSKHSKWLRNLKDDFTFETREYPAGYDFTVGFIGTADFDNDGYIDIYAGNHYGKQEWYRNTDGLGNFEEGQNFSSGAFNIVELSDFDGDGDIDVLKYANDASDINIDINNGLGQFLESINLATNFFSISNISVMHLNDDNDLDILVTSKSNDAVGWFENEGGNTYQFSIIDDDLDEPSISIALDLDLDGDKDIYTQSRDEGLLLFKNDGLGNFDAKEILDINVNGGILNYGDFDHDDDIDLIASSGTVNRISVIINDSGNLEDEILISGYLKNVDEIIIADIDDDGHQDIVSTGDGTIAWYKNLDGIGDYSNKIIISENEGSVFDDSEKFIVFIDFDNDGDKDIFTNSSSRIFYFENLDGKGEFSITNEITSGLEEISNFIFFDYDNDGLKDILYSYYPDRLVFKKNLGNNWGNEVIISSELSAISILRTGDLDNDGDLDVLAVSNSNFSWGDGNIYLLINENGVLLDPVETGINAEGIGLVEVVDFNNDALLDILISGNNGFSWYKNLGGTFSAENEIFIGSALSAEVADFDNNGTLDIVADHNSFSVFWQNLDGDGEFNWAADFDFKMRRSASGDIDGDNDIDLVNGWRLGDDGNIDWQENLLVDFNQIIGNVKYGNTEEECQISNNYVSGLRVNTQFENKIRTTITNDVGAYNLYAGIGNYVTSITDNLPDHFVITPEMYSSDLVGQGIIEELNFCIVPTNDIKDVEIELLPISQARPGFIASYILIYKNLGTETMDGEVSIKYPENKIDVHSISEMTTSETNDQLYFEFNDLKILESRAIEIDFQLNTIPVISIGEELIYTASINANQNDQFEENNEFILKHTVIGSYDPNDIQVLEGSIVDIDNKEDYLHYIIRFQNTGTAEAINVKVENQLDENLNPETIEILSSSHTNRVYPNFSHIEKKHYIWNQPPTYLKWTELNY